MSEPDLEFGASDSELADALDRAQVALRERGDPSELLGLFGDSCAAVVSPLTAERPDETTRFDLAPGARVGEFVIGEVIGRGGMGTVYAANQVDPARPAAIKVMREPDALDGYFVRQFRREAAALARLKHPNIVGVYSAGVLPDGRPWLAMERAEGEDLEVWLRQDPPLPRRLRLFALICDALQHAHSRGVIHRDLKPTNVRIGPEDQPRVLDFGLVLLADRGAEESRPAALSHLLGTIPWMSPEQVAGEIVDVRSDVHALGTLLYRLVTRAHPFAFDPAHPLAALKVIASTPPREHPALRGDLRRIVERALRKDPDARFQSAREFADEVRRILAGRPIESRPPTLTERLTETYRRHPALVTICSALAILIAVISFAYARVDDARSRAEVADLSQRAAMRFFASVLRASDPDGLAAGDRLLSGVVRDAHATLSSDDSLDALGRASIEALVGSTLLGIGDPERAVERLASACAGFRDAGVDPVAFSLTLGDYGHALHAAERFELAEQVKRQTLAIRRAELAEDHPARIDAHFELANLLRDVARFDEATNEVNEVAASARRRDDFALLADCQRRIAEIRANAGDQVAQRELLNAALANAERVGESGVVIRSRIRSALALAQRVVASFDDSYRHITSALAELESRPAEHRAERASVLCRGAQMLRDERRFDEAVVMARAALDLAREVFGADAPRTRLARETLGNILLEIGRFDEARRLADESVAGAERAYGVGSSEWRRALLTRSVCANVVGDTAAALADMEAISRSIGGDSRVDLEATCEIQQQIVAIHRARRDHAAALIAARAWLAAASRLVNRHRSGLDAARLAVGQESFAVGDYAASAELLREALRGIETGQGPRAAAAGFCRIHLARALARCDRPDEARVEAARGLEIATAVRGANHPEVESIRGELVAEGLVEPE